MEHYLALKREEIVTSVTTWMNLEDVTLNEISQLQKDRYCVIPPMSVTDRHQIVKTERGAVVAGACGRGN